MANIARFADHLLSTVSRGRAVITLAIILTPPALAALTWLAIEWRRALAQFELAGRGVTLERSHDL